jgi:DNA-binding transcriptional ArsR family regulator
MDREQLTALRDLLNLILELPDSMHGQIAQWLTQETAKPNGRDPHPPPIAPTEKQLEKAPGARTDLEPLGTAPRGPIKPSPRRSPTPDAVKVRQSAPFNTKAAERRLLEALQEHSGASVNVLAKAAGASRSSTGERLRKLAAQGALEKDPDGRWRLKREEPRPPDPQQPSPS